MVIHTDLSSQFEWLWRFALCMSVLVCPGNCASGLRVEIRAGNVCSVDTKGHARQITSGGTDYDPSLSFDGTEVIFVRRTPTPAGFEEPTDLHPFRTEIRIASATRAGPSRLAFGGTIALQSGQ